MMGSKRTLDSAQMLRNCERLLREWGGPREMFCSGQVGDMYVKGRKIHPGGLQAVSAIDGRPGSTQEAQLDCPEDSPGPRWRDICRDRHICPLPA